MSRREGGAPGPRGGGDPLPVHPREQPPRLARALLRLVLPRDARDDAITELDEKFAAYAASAMGPRQARRWYRRQVAGVFDPRLWRRPFSDPSPRTVATKGRRSLAFNAMNDVRFGLRMLAKNPGLTAVIVVTLTIGLGFNGAIFSIVNTIVLNELPIEEPRGVLFINSNNLSQGRDSLRVSWADYQDFAAANESFATMAAWAARSINVSDGVAAPERFAGALVEPSMFEVLRLRPVRGRALRASDADPGAEPVALLGHGVWQTRYGADPGIVGRVVQINGAPATVIGVLPPELERTPFRPQVWIPLTVSERMRNDRDMRFLFIAGRLRDGASPLQAGAEIRQVASRLAAEHRDTNEGVGVAVGDFDEIFGDDANQIIALVLMGAVVFLLLIACANVANLLISLSIQRRREVVVRAALGASRWRVIRQLLVESLLLSAMAAVGGIGLAIWGVRALERAIVAAAPPEYWNFSIRPSVFLFIVVLSMLTSVVFGLVPALHATRRDAGASLRDGERGSGGRRTRRLTGALVVAQVALSLVLLAGAGVMVRSTLNVLDVDWSVAPEDVLTMRLSLPAAAYPDSANIVAFHDQLSERVAALPGVETIAVASSFPSDGGFTVSAEIEGRPVGDGNPAATLTQMIVSPEYFDLAGVGPLSGRLFDRRDGLDDELVVVVERRAAERYWPDEDPVGRRLRWIGETETRWARVIGIVPDLTLALEMDFIDLHPAVYTPFHQEPLRGVGVMVRSSVDPGTMAALLRAEAAELDADLPLFDIAPLSEVINERTVGWRVVAVLFALLGAIALFLACIGIYAVMAFAVGNRRREIGIRMALGARGVEIVRLVARTSVVQMVAGLLLGLVGAVYLTRVIAIFMYEVSPTDPLTFGLVFALLGATALLASWLPARRASRVDPVAALRRE